MAIRSRFPRHAGDVLTMLRIAGTPIFVMLVWSAPRSVPVGWVAGGLFVMIAASDFFDGRLARRAGAAGTRGRVLDHGADIAFVLAALGAYVALGVAPWWVPVAIAASFATYVYGSWQTAGSGRRTDLVPSRVGHIGGVLNYVLIGILVFNNSAAVQLLSRDLLRVLFALVPLYSGAAILQRWRRAPARPRVDAELQQS